MADVRYSKEHEWIRVEGELATVGISQYAQEQLGDVVFVEVPQAGRKVAKGEACAVVESVKAASDVYSPVGGTVTASNAALATQPELLNQDPYGAGWMFRVQTTAPIDDGLLMSAADYARYLEESK